MTHTAAAWGSLASVVALVLELDTVPGADTSGETVPALDGFGFVGGAVAGVGCVSHPHGQRWQ